MPHNLEAEQAVIGGLLIDPEAWDRLGDALQPEDFYFPPHVPIFTHLRRLAQANKGADALVLTELLSQEDIPLDRVDRYLADLQNHTPSAANITAYATIVRELSILRRAMDMASRIHTLAKQPEGRPITDVMLEIEREVFALVEHQVLGKPTYHTMREAAREAFREIQRRHESPGQLLGESTGLATLDDWLLGLQSGDLILLAARPSQGKTALAMQIAEQVARRRTVLVFSMEMSASQLTMRLIAGLARIDGERLRKGTLETEHWIEVGHALTQLVDRKLIIDDSSALTATEVRAKARRIAREHDLALIVIDYLQLMSGEGSEANRSTELAEISRGLKALAKELCVPVLALSQLNRALESRSDKRPMMSDLRESGGLEADADVILFVHRECMYDSKADSKDAELIIGKQRMGPVGTIHLTFEGSCTKFLDRPQPTQDTDRDPRRRLRED